MDNTENQNKPQQPIISHVSHCEFCKAESVKKLETHDWLQEIPASTQATDFIEVRFKNTRKDFFRNSNGLRLKLGDLVAVEASPGHDIGIVSLTGELVLHQMKRNGVSFEEELKRIYRKAKPADIDKWKESISMEQDTMIRARKIADDLKLNMKIGDVEYQGDRTKAIFYYIADERVDFRELIKVLADAFKVRIEMKQIGARQEAGRIGGIGSCGRELCCSKWISNFVSVTTNSARYQEISLNPQKLAGQCSKLKCCLNYELDCYMDAQKDYPAKEVILKVEKGDAYHLKTDIYRGIMWYSFHADIPVDITPVPVERVKEIIELNKKRKVVETLVDVKEIVVSKMLDFENVVGQDSLTRFEDKKPRPKKNKPRNKKRRNRPHKRPGDAKE